MNHSDDQEMNRRIVWALVQTVAAGMGEEGVLQEEFDIRVEAGTNAVSVTGRTATARRVASAFMKDAAKNGIQVFRQGASRR